MNTLKSIQTLAKIGKVFSKIIFVAIHSVMNKATGALLFLLPLTIPAVGLKTSAVIVCAAATFAAIQEGYFIRTGRE